MSLAHLFALAGPPPDDPVRIDWTVTGTRCPGDFRAFVDRYGLGGWDDFELVVPHTGSDDAHRTKHAELRLRRDEAPGEMPFAFDPEPGGMIQWGFSLGDHAFCWDTTGDDPDTWPTWVFTDDGHHRLDLGFTVILTALFTDGLHLEHDRITAIGPCEPLDGPPEFRPGLFTESTTGDDIPADYLALIAVTGPGTVGGLLRLLAPGGPDGFDSAEREAAIVSRIAEHRVPATARLMLPIGEHPAAARPWGEFTTGETCWWLRTSTDPAEWPVVVVGADGIGWQRLNTAATEFLRAWTSGELDLPVLSHGAIARDPAVVPAGEAVPAPVVAAERDVIEQLATIIGPPMRSPRPVGWDAVYAELGVRGLPSDYRRLWERYGPMSLNGMSICPPAELAARHRAMSEHLGEYFTDAAPRLFAMSTWSRGTVWWEIGEPDPDQWPVVWEYGEQRHEGGLIAAVLDDLTGRLDVGFTLSVPSRAGPEIM